MGRVLLVVLLLGAASIAQDKPDFSGHWVLEQPPSPPADIARELIVSHWSEWQVPDLGGQSFPFEIITIEQRSVGSERGSYRYQIGLSGGLVGGIDATGRGSGPNGQVPQTTFSTRWNGSRLAIERASYSGWNRDSGPFTELSEEWSLDADRLVIVTGMRSSTSDPTTITLTYKRR